MDINVARRPEQVLRGMDRLFAVAVDAIPQLPSRSRATSRIPSRWLIERGETRVETAVSVAGGFPGSLRSMNRIDASRLVCTARYLVIGEGTAQGFAIPMRDVLAASVVRPDRRSNHGLVVWYRDGDQTGSFFLAFRGLPRNISGVRRADEVMQFLVGRGVEPVDARDARFTPRLHRSWNQVDELAREEIVWAGNAVAAVGGWFGVVHDACRVWFTPRTLLWAGAGQDGVNQVPLSEIVEVRDGASDRVSVGLRDELRHRYDVIFDLAASHPQLDWDENPRVQFMNAIASHGVSVDTASTPLAPWRSGSLIRPMDRQILGRLL